MMNRISAPQGIASIIPKKIITCYSKSFVQYLLFAIEIGSFLFLEVSFKNQINVQGTVENAALEE